MKKGNFIVVLTGVFIAAGLLGAPLAGAQDDLLQRMQAMESRIEELEERLAVYEGKDARYTEQFIMVEQKVDGVEERLNASSSRPADALLDGIEIGAGSTFVYQATHRANGDDLSGNSEDSGAGSYSVDIELSKEFDDYGKLMLAFEAGEGEGVDNQLKTFGSVNADATGSDATVSLIEAWYEQYAGPAVLRFGKIDPTGLIDMNEYANDETSQFLGGIFRNNPVTAFPDNGAGIRLAAVPHDLFEIESLVMDGDGGWDQLMDDAFYALQVNVKPGLLGRSGNYRFYGWGSNRDHTQWNNDQRTKEKNYGFGMSFDQAVSDDLGIFFRYGWQNPKVYLNDEDFSLEQSYSLGMQLAGTSWNREEDYFGLGYGAIIPSDEYKKSAGPLKADTEHTVEAYYHYRLNDHVAVSPSLQVIWNPYGNDAVNGDKTILVGGIRSQIDF